MASAELRQIRRRIRSVESTMKITRAMELIATARIGKAQARVAASKPYTAKMTEVIRNIAAASGGLTHPLFEVRDLATVGVLVVTSDRGLAGAYNGSVIRLAEHHVVEHREAGRAVRLYVVGKKALTYFRYRRYQIEHSWLGVTDTPTYADGRGIANVLLDEYMEGRVDGVEVYTTRYVSALTQVPERYRLLPITPPEAEEEATPVGYTFEPSPEEILDRLLPRYLEGSMFGMLLEASASEHAARRRAMKAATENAEELTRILTREANQARQAEITTEISEIVGGAEALARG
ncbi:MAG TPA: F0F1 ATP synthase subunit gamma [Actinobacteria bacterium]|nr:F0F1 ATP synthase subunit gamma [Actinomycetota bacterium]